MAIGLNSMSVLAIAPGSDKFVPAKSIMRCPTLFSAKVKVLLCRASDQITPLKLNVVGKTIGPLVGYERLRART